MTTMIKTGKIFGNMRLMTRFNFYHFNYVLLTYLLPNEHDAVANDAKML